MMHRYVDLDDVQTVARGLQALKSQMVFVGGAIVGLYADELVVEEIRPTEDIDMAITLLSFHSWVAIQEQLSGYGFHPDPFGHAICSYKYKELPVDIMPAEDGPLGPANRWYKLGFDDLWIVKVKDVEIQILPAPCYLATKFEAFNDRGNDYRTSHDMEDILFVISHRSSIVAEIGQSKPEILAFLQKEIRKIRENRYFEEILAAHISPHLFLAQKSLIEEKMDRMISIQP